MGETGVHSLHPWETFEPRLQTGFGSQEAPLVQVIAELESLLLNIAFAHIWSYLSCLTSQWAGSQDEARRQSETANRTM